MRYHFFCTMDGFSRILEKKLSELLCTRLHFYQVKLGLKGGILSLLGMYFDAVVVEVNTFIQLGSFEICVL